MKKAIIAICFLIGVCLIGSDGDYFPKINCIGLVVFSLVPILIKIWGIPE
jgi:hypothetical protein